MIKKIISLFKNKNKSDSYRVDKITHKIGTGIDVVYVELEGSTVTISEGYSRCSFSVKQAQEIVDSIVELTNLDGVKVEVLKNGN